MKEITTVALKNILCTGYLLTGSKTVLTEEKLNESVVQTLSLPWALRS